MSDNHYADVRDFHRKVKAHVGYEPTIPNQETKELRVRLLFEEMEELAQAIVDDDLVGVADGCADLIYSAIGTLVSYGIDLQPVWNEVHRTNMLKEPGPDGKAVKPEGWEPPHLSPILKLMLRRD